MRSRPCLSWEGSALTHRSKEGEEEERGEKANNYHGYPNIEGGGDFIGERKWEISEDKFNLISVGCDLVHFLLFTFSYFGSFFSMCAVAMKRLCVVYLGAAASRHCTHTDFDRKPCVVHVSPSSF